MEPWQGFERRGVTATTERMAAGGAGGRSPVAEVGQGQGVAAAAGRPHGAPGAAEVAGIPGDETPVAPAVSSAGSAGEARAVGPVVRSGTLRADGPRSVVGRRAGRLPSGLRRQECAGLLAYLRAAIDQPVPTVVIAGVGQGAAAASIAGGLAEAARDGGLRLFSAELGAGSGWLDLQQRRVVPLVPPGRGDRRLTAGGRPVEGAGGNGGPAPVPDDDAAAGAATAGGTGGGSERWLEQGGSGVDFVLVAAPPLDGAADAALLARACDGLVLVVESAVTSRESLRRAVCVAETSGCRLLGLVMSEPRRALPDWLRRLVRGASGRHLP